MPDSQATNRQAQQEVALLFLHALTAVHPGSGTALGTVDLPIQRERHTQWPVIPGSSIKGILREACRPAGENGEKDHEWLAAFGPKTAEADKHAGALSFTDARILAFPVRSLKGIFAWVTCPAVLERLNRDLELADMASSLTLPRQPEKNTALCLEKSPILVDGNQLVLEEFDFKRSGDPGPAAGWIAEHAVKDDFAKARLRTHLAVLHDDDFTHFVRHATEVVARIALDYERKTVKSRALFYEEFLPAETLFYSLVVANASRRMEHETSANGMMNYLNRKLPREIQVGAGETIGKGLCAVRLVTGKGGGQ